MAVKGGTGERGDKLSPNSPGTVSPSGAAPVACPANLVSFPHLYTQEMVQTHLLGYSEDKARFLSQAAEDFGKCFGGEL